MALIAYFDASGNRRERIVALGGLLARVDQWDAFNEEWSVLLAAEGVREFHMKDFAHSTGEFRPWKGDEPRRRAFIQAFTAVMARHTLKSIAIGTFVEEYLAANRVFRLQEMLGGPYAFTSFFALVTVQIWRDENAPGEEMSVVMERGDPGQAQLRALLRHHEFDEIDLTFAPKRLTVNGLTTYCYPFQACDFIAWETAKVNRTLLEQEERGRRDGVVKVRESLLQIAPKAPDPAWRYIDRTLLAETIRRFKIHRRA